MENILDINAGLDLVDNDKELYLDLLNFYLTENNFDVKTLENLIMKNEEEAASYIHRVKGASRQICAKAASEKGQEIEDILRKKKEGNLAPLINEFCRIYDATVKAVTLYIKENSQEN